MIVFYCIIMFIHIDMECPKGQFIEGYIIELKCSQMNSQFRKDIFQFNFNSIIRADFFRGNFHLDESNSCNGLLIQQR